MARKLGFRSGSRSCSGEPESGGDASATDVPGILRGAGRNGAYHDQEEDEADSVARRRCLGCSSPPRIARRSSSSGRARRLMTRTSICGMEKYQILSKGCATEKERERRLRGVSGCTSVAGNGAFTVADRRKDELDSEQPLGARARVWGQTREEEEGLK